MNPINRPEVGRRESAALPVMLYRNPAREVWQVEGERAIDALNGLFTNDLSGPESGVVIPCLALTPRGRPLADLRVWKRSPESGPVILDLSAAGSETLREHLGRYLPPRFARIVALENARLMSLWGPRASSVLAQVLGGAFEPAPADRFSEAEYHSGPVLVAGRPEAEGGGWELLVPHGDDRLASALLTAVKAAGGHSVSDATWERLRIERGIPRYGVDYGLQNLPQETGLTARTVSFEKGCYTGQEVVARIHYRGHVNQRLAGLSRDGGDSIPVGTELFDGDRRVGDVSSATDSPEFGAIALGMVRREVETGTKLSTSPGAQRTIEVRSLPFTAS
ncbi:MAG: glycine cleavage T C-terminal barrel domain-containing protein [Gemmatimonadota bacterium]